jgi:hypothetical protein
VAELVKDKIVCKLPKQYRVHMALWMLIIRVDKMILVGTEFGFWTATGEIGTLCLIPN